jgi:hypothetical protein
MKSHANHHRDGDRLAGKLQRRDPAMRSVTVHLSGFACEAIAGPWRSDRENLPARVIGAIRCYLRDSGTEQAGWVYPHFLPEEARAEEVALRLNVEDELWHSLEEEAERQHVSAERMVEHAAFYFAAEMNAGRVTQRIIADFDDD